MNHKKTKLETFIKYITGNFLSSYSIFTICGKNWPMILVYSSKKIGAKSLDYYYNMTVKYCYADKDEDGDAVLKIFIDSWDN